MSLTKDKEMKTELTDSELIAEFMGVPQLDDNGTRVWDTTGSNKLIYALREHNLHYRTSWDWLMPVVEKIESIRHIGVDAVYVQINKIKCQIWTYFDVKEFLRLTGDDNNDRNKFKVGYSGNTKIEATYHAVVEFIKWYNANKPE